MDTVHHNHELLNRCGCSDGYDVEVPFGPDDTNDGLPNTQGGGLMPIDSVLKRASHGEIHTLRITSDDVNSHPDGYLVVNVLVLVSNE